MPSVSGITGLLIRGIASEFFYLSVALIVSTIHIINTS
jgi:hypothetical protein